jgi:AcrR family transcriptional regulator
MIPGVGQQLATSERRRRATALSPDERRESIVAAARPLLIERGEKVTTQEIATAAGIAEGTIFRVFPTKDELIGAVLEEALDHGPTEAAIAAIDTGLDLERFVAAVVRILQQRGVDTWQLMTSVGFDYHRRHSLDRRRYSDSAALAGALGRYRKEMAIEPREASRVLFSMVMALTHPALTAEPVPAERVAALYLRGVGRC